MLFFFFFARNVNDFSGTPTATQLENPQFITIFDGGNKVDLANKLLTTISYKKDLEFSVSKLVRVVACINRQYIIARYICSLPRFLGALENL